MMNTGTEHGGMGLNTLHTFFGVGVFFIWRGVEGS